MAIKKTISPELKRAVHRERLRAGVLALKNGVTFYETRVEQLKHEVAVGVMPKADLLDGRRQLARWRKRVAKAEAELHKVFTDGVTQ